MGNLASVNYVTEKVDGALSFRVKSNEYFIPMGDAIDVEAEKAKLEEELKYTEGFLKSTNRNMLIVSTSIDELIFNMNNYKAPKISKVVNTVASK